MVEITKDPKFRAELLEKIRTREFSDRTGIHMSDLNYCLNKQALRRQFPIENTDREVLLFSGGWATQRWLTGKDEDEPEREVDGIIVTLDCTTDYKGEEIPWELKSTYQSTSRAIEDNPAWIRQIAAQCYVKGVTDAKLTRLSWMGAWKWVFNMSPKPEKLARLIEEHGENWDEHPTLEAYHLAFTNEELLRNWEWFLARRLLFVGLLEDEELLSKALAIPSGQTYECEYCGYAGKECTK